MRLRIILITTTLPFLGGSDSAESVQSIPELKIDTNVTQKRPYSEESPWNQKIGPRLKTEPNSSFYTKAFKGDYGCNALSHTRPIYEVNAETSWTSVAVSGWYSDVQEVVIILNKQRDITVSVPIPEETALAQGTDGQILFWNPKTGDEWGFWKVEPSYAAGVWKTRNGYHYNTNWNAVPLEGYGSRGVEILYFAGTVCLWQIAQSRI
jgi:hypothetical protein